MPIKITRNRVYFTIILSLCLAGILIAQSSFAHEEKSTIREKLMESVRSGEITEQQAMKMLRSIEDDDDMDRNSKSKTIPEIAIDSKKFDTLVAAIKATNLLGALSADGPYTVFAPTDEAFKKLPAGTIEKLLNEPGRKTLKKILLNHVVAGKYNTDDLIEMESIKTLSGNRLDVAKVQDMILVGEKANPGDFAEIDIADLPASNGTIHVIDTVLIPTGSDDPLEDLMENAIKRGATQYNNDDPKACCDIYETALDAVVLGRCFGLSQKETMEVKKHMCKIKKIESDKKRAWGYRKLIDHLLEKD